MISEDTEQMAAELPKVQMQEPIKKQSNIQIFQSQEVREILSKAKQLEAILDISDDQKNPQNSENKECQCFMLIGPAKSGKTKFVNFLKSSKICIPSSSKKTNIQIDFDGEIFPKSTSSEQDVYKIGEYKDSYENILYYDTPGFSRVEGPLFQNFKNLMLLTKKLKEHQGKIKVVLVLRISDITNLKVMKEVKNVIVQLFPNFLNSQNSEDIGLVLTEAHEKIHLKSFFQDNTSGQTQLSHLIEVIDKLVFDANIQFLECNNSENIEMIKFIKHLRKCFVPSPIYFIEKIQDDYNLVYSLNEQEQAKYISGVKEKLKALRPIQHIKEQKNISFQHDNVEQMNNLLEDFRHLFKHLGQRLDMLSNSILESFKNEDKLENERLVFEIFGLLLNIFVDEENYFVMDQQDIEAEKKLFSIIKQLNKQEIKENYLKSKEIAKALNFIRPIGEKMQQRYSEMMKGEFSKSVFEEICSTHHAYFQKHARYFIQSSVQSILSQYQRYFAHELEPWVVSDVVQLLKNLQYEEETWFEVLGKSQSQISFLKNIDWAFGRAFQKDKFNKLKLLFKDNVWLTKNIIKIIKDKRFLLVNNIKQLAEQFRKKVIKQNTKEGSHTGYIQTLKSFAKMLESPQVKKRVTEIQEAMTINQIVCSIQTLDTSIYSLLNRKIQDFHRENVLLQRSLGVSLSSNYFDEIEFLVGLYKPYLQWLLTQLIFESFEALETNFIQNKTNITENNLLSGIIDCEKHQNLIEKLNNNVLWKQTYKDILDAIVTKPVDLEAEIKNGKAQIEKELGVDIDISGTKVSGKVFKGKFVFINESIKTEGGDLYVLADYLIISKQKQVEMDLSNSYEFAEVSPDFKPRNGKPGKNSGNAYFIYKKSKGLENLTLKMKGGKGQKGQNALTPQKQSQAPFPILKIKTPDQNFHFDRNQSESESKWNKIKGDHNTQKCESLKLLIEALYDSAKQQNENKELEIPRRILSEYVQVPGFDLGELKIVKGRFQNDRDLSIIRERKFCLKWADRFIFSAQVIFNYEHQNQNQISGQYDVYHLFHPGKKPEDPFRGGKGGFDGYNGFKATASKHEFKLQDNKEDGDQGNVFQPNKKQLKNCGQKGKDGCLLQKTLINSLTFAIYRSKPSKAYCYFTKLGPFSHHQEHMTNKTDRQLPQKLELNPLPILKILIGSALCKDQEWGYIVATNFFSETFLSDLFCLLKQINEQNPANSFLEKIFDIGDIWISILSNKSREDNTAKGNLKNVGQALCSFLDGLNNEGDQDQSFIQYKQGITQHVEMIKYWIQSLNNDFSYLPVEQSFKRVCENIQMRIESLKHEKNNEYRDKIREENHNINKGNFIKILQLFEDSSSSITSQFDTIQKLVDNQTSRFIGQMKMQIRQNRIQKQYINSKIQKYLTVLRVLEGVKTFVNFAIPGITPIGKVIKKAGNFLIDKAEHHIQHQADHILQIGDEEGGLEALNDSDSEDFGTFSERMKRRIEQNEQECEEQEQVLQQIKKQEELSSIKDYRQEFKGMKKQLLNAFRKIGGQHIEANFLQFVGVVLKARDKFHNAIKEIQQQIQKIKYLGEELEMKMKDFDQLNKFLLMANEAVEHIIKIASCAKQLCQQDRQNEFIKNITSDSLEKPGIASKILLKISQKQLICDLETLKYNIELRSFPFPFESSLEKNIMNGCIINYEILKKYANDVKNAFEVTGTRQESFFIKIDNPFPCYHWSAQNTDNLRELLQNLDNNRYFTFRANCLYWNEYSAIALNGRPQFTIYHPDPYKLIVLDGKTYEEWNNQHNKQYGISQIFLLLKRKFYLNDLEYQIMSDRYLIRGPKYNPILEKQRQRVAFRTLEDFKKAYTGKKQASIVNVKTTYTAIAYSDYSESRAQNNEEILIQSLRISPYGNWDLCMHFEENGYSLKKQQIKNCILRLEAKCNVIDNTQLKDTKSKIRKNFEHNFIGNKGEFNVKFNDL